jgi:hypothetical protein
MLTRPKSTSNCVQAYKKFVSGFDFDERFGLLDLFENNFESYLSLKI